ncbi:DMT family transporter [Denitromonas iodatirespirans]|uniref:EamA family transporter n=1 Tax=Denitromonas iodatirespirans TaxID=2795389 RepID=A0A944DIZ7_DENI1|nr:EamA family transporter [Denitromonas iodatirespirans]MBT0963783.1 EamA family transporter [Denitromonas iodatirespirans]
MIRLPAAPALPQLPPALLLLLTAAIWGSSYSVVKTALAWYPVAGVIAIRFLLTALLLAPYWLRLPSAQRRQTLAVAAPTSLGLLAIFFAETAGVAHTSAGNAAFLISLCLLLTPPVEWAWFGRRPAARLWLAAGISLLGTWLLTDVAAGGLNGGDALMLLAALLRAFQGCLTTRLLRGKAVDHLGLTAAQGLLVGGGALAVLAFTGGVPALPSAGAFWVALGYLTLACTLFAFWAMNRALAQSDPTRVALLLGSEPLWGALFAVLWLGEPLGPSGWLGGVMIAGAALWTSVPRDRGADRANGAAREAASLAG